MSKRITLNIVICTVAMFILSPFVSADTANSSKMHTYDKASGESYYAMSLSPNIELSTVEAHDILVLVDTSASQVGAYRRDAMICLESLLANLGKQHRVNLMAVDLFAVEMSTGFVSPTGAQIDAAIKKLNDRVALGSTDMVEILSAVAQQYEVKSNRPRSVVYIGDGMSKANLLQITDYKRVVNELVAKRISISTFAIGPRRNIQLLASLSNSTGGVIRVDNSDPQTSTKSGFDLAGAVTASVVWPTQLTFSQGMDCVYTSITMPPLRSDRDTILVGELQKRGNFDVALVGEVNGQSVKMQWTVSATGSNEDYNFLPALIEAARPHSGIGLATLGTEGLTEVRQSIQNNVKNLNQVGLHALKTGDVKGAIDVADEVLRKDPTNTKAKAIKGAAERGPVTTEIALIQQPAAPAATVPAPNDANALVLDGGPADLEDSVDFLTKVERERSVRAGKLIVIVENGLEAARDIVGIDPAKARQDLKLIREQVEAATDVSGEIRQKLRKQIEDAIREASVRQIGVDSSNRLTQVREANAARLKDMVDETTRKQELITRLMEKFNVLMDEAALKDDRKRVDEGEEYLTADAEIAMPIRTMLPYSGTPTAAVWKSRILRQYSGLEKFRDLRHKNFADVMYENEEALIPFPGGDSPIRYPEAEFWHRITVERKKYVLDLGNNPAEQKIIDELDNETRMTFFDTPLKDVIDTIKGQHNIPIIIDERALTDIGFDSSMSVNIDLKGISLRSGLKLMLRSLGLTYVINDEVLKITTPEAAESELIVRTYEVGDLVMPIPSGMGFGGMGGGGMGMGGGQQGGGMGGGQQGGGMGMGGGGGGGMGGFQNVEDELSLGTKTAPATAPASARADKSKTDIPKAIEQQLTVIDHQPKDGESLDTAWNRYFKSIVDLSDEAVAQHGRQIRFTVQLKMIQAQRLHAQGGQDTEEKAAKAKRLVDESIAIMLAAMRNEQSQFWMYEGLGLAMQANHAPLREVERALMSAIDYSNNSESLLAVGIYMSEVGLHKRALSILQDVSEVNPYRPEPYVRGLAIAKRLGDLEGLKWATAGILAQAWTNDQKHIELDARHTAQALAIQLKQAGHEQAAKEFAQSISEQTARDCRIVVTWTGNADIDLHVQEPAGTVCSIQNDRTTSGGVMLGDTFAMAGNQPVNGYSESYVCPRAFKGEYRLLIRRVWGNVTAGKVTVDIYTDNPDRPHIHEQIQLDNKDAVVIFDVLHGRRVEPIGAHQLENMQKHQEVAGRQILAQQLNNLSNSDAARDFAIARKMAARDGRFFVPGRGGVGYRPEITVLPSGANLTAMSPIVSPDRRYVRISIPPTPIATGVGDIRTFNFATGAAQGFDDERDNDNNAQDE
jgi:tetratricopeptide (TPR) repeat protein